MHPRSISSWEHNAPKIISFSTFNFHESSWREQTYAPNSKGKTTQGGQVLHSQIQPKQLMLGRDLRGRRKRRTTKELQNLDPLSSPHLEEKLIGGNVDLGLLSCFPKDGQESLEGLGEGKVFQGQQWWERERNSCCRKPWPFGEEGGLL